MSPEDARKALQRHLTGALAELGGKPPLRDRSVHEARKELKRARSALRILRDAIGETAYHRSNQRLRDAAGPLSGVRDAKVLLDAAVRLRASTKNASRRAELSSFERQLRTRRRRAQSEFLEGTADLRKLRSSVESVLTESRRWPASTVDSACSGVARVYRKGRKAFARADASRRRDALHESRKQAKYLSRALEVLAPSRRGPVAKRARRAESIADVLGDDHDLAMLREKLMARRPRKASARAGVIADIARRREKLQRRASKKGRRLYRRKPKAFVRALEFCD